MGAREAAGAGLGGRRERAALVAAAIVLVAIQLFSLLTLAKVHPVWGDEGSYSDVAVQFVRHGNFAWPHQSGDYGFERSNVAFGRIYCGTLGVVYRVIGFGVFQGRLLSYVCALLSVLLTFLIVRRLGGGRVASAWAAVLTAAAYITVDTAHTARPEAMLTTAATLGLYLLILAIERDSLWLYALTGLAAGLAADVHINGACVPIALAVVAIGLVGWKRAFVRIAPPFAGGALVGAAWWLATHVLPDPALFKSQWSFWSPMAEPPAAMILRSPLGWVAYEAGRILTPGMTNPALVLTITYWALFALALAAFAVPALRAPERPRTRAVLAPAVFVGALTAVMLVAVSQRLQPYYAYTIPEIAATVALVGASLRRPARIGLAAVAALVAAASVAGTGYLAWKLRAADYDAWTSRLHRDVPAGSTVFGWQDLRFGFDDVTFRGYTSQFYDHAPPGSYVVIGKDLVDAAPKGDPRLAAILSGRGTVIDTVTDPVYGRNLSTAPKKALYTTYVYRLR